MTIEERIQALRKSKGLSQEQLAEALGVSRQAVSKWESGQSLPEVEKLLAMSALFSVSIDYILKGEEPAPAQSGNKSAARVGAQIVLATATMLLITGLAATFGQMSDGTYTMDIYGGLIIVSVGIAAMLISWFLAGGRAGAGKTAVCHQHSAGGHIAGAAAGAAGTGDEIHHHAGPTRVLVGLFAVFYIVICGVALYFAVIRKQKPRSGGA